MMLALVMLLLATLIVGAGWAFSPARASSSNPGLVRLVGGLLIAAGVLIALLSGLCTVVGALALTSSWNGVEMNGSAKLGGLAFALSIGAVPFVFGVVLIFAGNAAFRASGKAEDKP